MIISKKPVEDGIVIFSDIEIETADYTIKVYESEDEFGFDDDYTFIGESTHSLINISDLIGSRMKVESIEYKTDYKLLFPEEYDYYIFLEKQLSSNTYYGILTGVFRKTSVMYSEKTTIIIPDLGDPSSVLLVKDNKQNEPFVYDKNKQAIVDFEKKNTLSASYIYLPKESCKWTVSYIGSNSRLLKESHNLIKKKEYYKNKPFTIWKN